MSLVTGFFGRGFRFGTRRDDEISGSSGTDWLFGRGGSDAIGGGEGDDWLFGGRGDDRLRGGEGNDFLEGGRGDDDLLGAAGDDLIDGGRNFDTAHYSGSVADYGIEREQPRFSWLPDKTTVTDLVSANGDDGTDTLWRVEKLQFADYALYLDGRNNDPFAQNDQLATDENTPLTFDAGELLANDLEFDFDTLSLTALDTSGLQGALTKNVDGTFTYDPGAAFQSLAAGETAIDAFDYTVSDGNGGTATATVSLDVTGAEDNVAPVAELTAGPGDDNQFWIRQTITFDASKSFDGDGSIVKYLWKFGDGTDATTASPQVGHSYSSIGSYTAFVQVTDDEGLTDQATFDFSVREPGKLLANFTTVPTVLQGPAPFTVFFTNTSTSGGPDITDLIWQTGDGDIEFGDTITHTYHAPGTHFASLTAVDELERSDTAYTEVTVTLF
jgi:VCBS repeat-containing protein